MSMQNSSGGERKHKPSRLTETRALRAKLADEGQYFEWCSEIKGFGVRLTPAGRNYIVQVGSGNEKKRLNLGRVGVLPFESIVNARGETITPGARDLALAAINAARRGQNPRIAIGQAKEPEGVTLKTVWNAYEEAGQPKLRGVGKKRDITATKDKQRYKLLIEPKLGDEVVSEIDTAKVQRWLDGISSEGQKSHALVLLKSLLTYAASRAISKTNAIDIAVKRSREVQSFYTPDELQRLDAALVALIDTKPWRILSFSAVRLLIATGARLSEILTLEWANVDLDHGVLHLERDKTSENRRDILLTPAAVKTLKALPRKGNAQYVFFADSESGHIVDIQKPFLEAVKTAKVRRLRKHDLRHSFASAAIRQGVSLYVVGKLLGHRQATTTQRYAHLEHEVAREALAKIAAAMTPAPPPPHLEKAEN